jgi:hypothetical protein
MKKHPGWTDELVERCCTNYWAGADSGEAVWECLAQSFTVLDYCRQGENGKFIHVILHPIWHPPAA